MNAGRIRFRLILVIAGAAIAGCTPPPQEIGKSPPNNGVNLLPPAILAAQKVPPTTQPDVQDEKDLVQVISQSSEPHDQFLRVLRLSGMIPELRDKGPFTLFAPTDSALSKLPPGTLEDVEKPENQAHLRQILHYLIIPGRISFATLLDTNGEVKTLSGQTLAVRGIDRGVMVNDVTVIRTDTSAYNGIIHWVDGPIFAPE